LALLLVIQTGGMAVCAMTFARYFSPLVGLPLSEGAVPRSRCGAVAVNCLGVGRSADAERTDGGEDRGDLRGDRLRPDRVACRRAQAGQGQSSFLAALIPVLFSYGGFQTACFVAGELKDPRRDLPRALVTGVCFVILLYVGVAFACDRVLGKERSSAARPRRWTWRRGMLGARGAGLIAAGIAISSLGFLSQSILTARASTRHGGGRRVSPRRRPGPPAHARAGGAPFVLQGAVAIALLALGRTYEILLQYVVAIDFILLRLDRLLLFVFRPAAKAVEMPGHPVSTLLFMRDLRGSWLIATFVHEPMHSLIGLGLTLAGLPSTCSGGGTDEAPGQPCACSRSALGQEPPRPRVEAVVRASTLRACSRRPAPGRVRHTAHAVGHAGPGRGIVPAREWLAKRARRPGEGLG